MKKLILSIAIASLAITACNNTPKEPTRDELAQSIDSIESPIMNAAQIASVDTVQGNKLVELYVQFADAFPTDTLAPTYLHRAAQVANGMGLIDDMVTYYDRVIDNYPDYVNLDECYYEKGIALDNAGRKDEARKAYEEFLEEYPDHFLADDIRCALPLLDMSDEMLFEHLTNKAK
jgi:tetratricopeptide (TPR) repeat protein